MRRGRFTGEKQAVVDRLGEPGAVVGMAGQRVGIGASGKRVGAPGRGREGFQPAADVGSEEAGELVDGEGRHRRDAVAFELRGEPAAEKAVDPRTTQWA